MQGIKYIYFPEHYGYQHHCSVTLLVVSAWPPLAQWFFPQAATSLHDSKAIRRNHCAHWRTHYPTHLEVSDSRSAFSSEREWGINLTPFFLVSIHPFISLGAAAWHTLEKWHYCINCPSQKEFCHSNFRQGSLIKDELVPFISVFKFHLVL